MFRPGSFTWSLSDNTSFSFYLEFFLYLSFSRTCFIFFELLFLSHILSSIPSCLTFKSSPSLMFLICIPLYLLYFTSNIYSIYNYMGYFCETILNCLPLVKSYHFNSFFFSWNHNFFLIFLLLMLNICFVNLTHPIWLCMSLQLQHSIYSFYLSVYFFNLGKF